MQSMCDFANGKTPRQFVHPVVRAMILHFWLAYATARSDLLELVKLGLLSQDRRGKAMIFQPLPGLTDMLRQMSEKEEKPAPA